MAATAEEFRSKDAGGDACGWLVMVVEIVDECGARAPVVQLLFSGGCVAERERE